MMSLTTDGMNITEYMENDRQEYMLIRYKVVDNLSDEKYGKMFNNLQSEGILVNECYDNMECSDCKWDCRINSPSETRKDTKRIYRPSQIYYHIPCHHRFSKNPIV